MSNPLPSSGAVVADKYVVESLIGRGGMGAVYVVSHRVTQKRLALKVLLPQFLDQPEIVERFLREAQSAGRIQHRHVVDVFDVGQDGDVLYIVMPLLSGKPLSTLLREERVPLGRLLTIMARAMDGVSAAHAQGVIHRDLKPDNIYVCQGISGQLDDPKILDFGISRQADGLEARLTQSGVMLGTPHYMAFEQITGQRDLDARVDVYAVGAILYEALSGIPPYDAESIGGLAVRMMSGPPPPITDHCSGLPAPLASAIMRALERDRDQRFSTMAAFMEALLPFAQGQLDGSLPSPRPGVGHDPTLLALTPTPAPAELSLSPASGVRTQPGGSSPTPSTPAVSTPNLAPSYTPKPNPSSKPSPSGGPSRPLALSLHDEEGPARPTPAAREAPKRGPSLWVILAVLALTLPWLGSRIKRLLASTAEPAPAVEPAVPSPAPPAAASQSPSPALPAAPEKSALAPGRTEGEEVPRAPAPSTPEPAQLAAPVAPPAHESERPRRDGKRDGKRRGEEPASSAPPAPADDGAPTNPPLSAPAGEPPPEPPRAEAPAEAPSPEPAPRSEAPSEPAPSEAPSEPASEGAP
jgi:serine/threonine protein kinase